jgi:uncharacterized repeat protein (TIGR03806 family)
MKSRLCLIITMLLAALNLSAVDELPKFKPYQGSKLEGTRGKAMPYIVEPVFKDIKWAQPLGMTPVPGSPGHYLVIERYGKMWIVGPDGKRNLFFNAKNRTLNALFHPKYPEVPTVYLRWSHREMNLVKSCQVIKSKDGLIADKKTEKTIIEWHSRGHRGGDLLFGPDGCLYLSSGDGQKWGDPQNVAQDTTNLQASILRIDVHNVPAGKTYSVPKDNPFVGMAGTRPEIWAYGVRNPWRFTFRPGTNELWVGDNGDETWELVRKVTKGTNHGWSVFEGSHYFRPTNVLKGPVKVNTPPAVEHNHREMRSVIGGRWYQGKQFPELKGHYVYGGHVTGKLWAFKLEGGQPTKPVQIANTGSQIVSFCEDPEGEILIVSLNKGIFKMKKSPKGNDKPIPKLLSGTGLFTSTKTHTTAPGLLPYKVILPVFWDGATRERFIALPDKKKIHVRRTHRKADLLPPTRTRVGLDRWGIPAGAVLMQTFFLEGKKVETQITMNDDEEWRFLSYKWNDAQTDAMLVPDEGAMAEIKINSTTKQKWRFPSRAECAACHTHISMFAPGLHFGQLNRDVDYSELGGKTMNQIDMFRKVGFLPGNYALPPKEWIMSKPSDEKASLEERARDYLHVNCAHCHRETGMGGRAKIDLLTWRTSKDTNLIHGKPLVGFPGGDMQKNRLVVPGSPSLSDLYRRMEYPSAGRMPLFGGTMVDKEGLELIKKWIEKMKETK